MDSTYFNWNSDFVPQEDLSGRNHTLQDLLNSIPTDIPKNASEFDEELRKLVIALYSDAVQNESGEETQPNLQAIPEGVGSEVSIAGLITSIGNRECISPGIGIGNEFSHPDSSSTLPLKDIPCKKIPETSFHDSAIYEDREANFTSKGSKELFEGFKNHKMDDVNDGKTLQILTTVNSWLSKLSDARSLPKDASRDLFSSVSLLRDLPSPDHDDENHDEGYVIKQETPEGLNILEDQKRLLCDDIPDSISLPDVISEQNEADELCRPHSLSMISEESDSMMNQTSEEHDNHAQGCHSVLSETLSGCDSGIESFAAVAPPDDDVNIANHADLCKDESNSEFELAQESESENQQVAVRSESQLDSTSLFAPLNAGKDVELVTEPEVKQVTWDRKSPNMSKDTLEVNLDDLQLRLSDLDSLDPESKPGFMVDLNAQFESQIESFSNGYALVMNEKLQMQKLIWNLEERLLTEKRNNEHHQNQKLNVEDEKKELLVTISNLEKKLVEFEEQSKNRDFVIRNAMKNLNEKELRCGELISKVKTLEKQMDLKKEELRNTRSELNESLNVSEKAVKEKAKFEAELKLIPEAFQKLKKSKEWLEFQLKTFQESRTNLEVEFEQVKAEINEEKRTKSLLQSENVDLSKKLFQRNSALLIEKQEMLEQMENIEKEITESEARFKELEVKHRFLNDTLDKKGNMIALQERKIQSLIDVIENAESVENGLKTEIVFKNKALEELKAEVYDNETKRVELETTIENMSKQNKSIVDRCNKLEENIFEMNSVIETKGHDFNKLQTEKLDLETQLDLAKCEKSEIEKAAMKLKTDMQTVDRVFQIMKRDLAAKSSMLQNIDSKKIKLIQEMEDLQKYLNEQDEVQKDLRSGLNEKMQIIKELVCQKNELEEEVQRLNAKHESLKGEIKAVIAERDSAVKDCKDVKRQWMEAETKLQENLSQIQQSNEDLLFKNQKSTVDLKELSKKNIEIIKELECTRKNTQAEIAKLRSKENKLSANLKEKQNDWLKKEQTYETSIMSLINKLKNESVIRQQSERKYCEQEEVVKRQQNERLMITSAVSSSLKMFENIRKDKNLIKNNVLMLKSLNNNLLSFMLDVVNKLKQRTCQAEDENRTLRTKIENLISQSLLQQKSTVALQQQCAVERSKNAELENSMKRLHDQLLNAKDEQMDLQTAKESLQGKFHNYKEKSERKQGYMQIELDKFSKTSEELLDENCHLNEQIRKQDDEIMQLKNELLRKDDACKEYRSSAEELKKLMNKLQAENSEHERAYSEIQGTVFVLENQLGIERSHAVVLNDSVANLKWKCKQSSTEVQARDDEIRSLNNQHRSEIESLTSMLNVTKTELNSLRNELANARKEKLTFQRKHNDLNERLKQETSDHDSLLSEICQRNDALLRLKAEFEESSSISLKETVDLLVNKAYIDTKTRPDIECIDMKAKPNNSALDTVGKCMIKLRNEMDSLHTQMSHHVERWQSSKTQFRNFEANLECLQLACKDLKQKTKEVFKESKNDTAIK